MQVLKDNMSIYLETLENHKVIPVVFQPCHLPSLEANTALNKLQHLQSMGYMTCQEMSFQVYTNSIIVKTVYR